MPDSDETPPPTEWRQASKLYRRPLGLAWLIGAVAIPLLLAVIGYGVYDRSRLESNGPAGSLPSLTESALPTGRPVPPRVPELSLAPVSITRDGDVITLSGYFPAESAKAALLDAVLAAVGPDVNIVDSLSVDPEVESLDFAHSEPVFKAAATISDFTLNVGGDTITLAGTAGSLQQDIAVEQAVETRWPDLNIVNDMDVKGISIVGPGTPSPTAAAVPGAPGGGCANCGRVVS